jgi:hypothetical protein
MSEDQLTKAVGRVEGLGDPQALERVRTFVSAERKHRRVTIQAKIKRFPSSPENE